MSSMKKSSGIKIVVIGVILAALVIGYFYYVVNKDEKPQEEVVESTQVQTVLMRDLEKNYPPSPKEVVKYFSEISKCFYNEKYTEEELNELAVQIQGIYDDELIANKTQEEYIKDLKNDIAEMKANDRAISSYEVSASTDVEFFNDNGDSCARLYCIYNIRQGTNILQNRIVFILRQDEDKHWKILGWDLDD
ncbi:MAG: hypothetical protein NC231_00035 [Bacillus sp. (in: Bacteria)]|nr:hypothetical protein [Bacillus sp. (in: firmicutes)]MCM1426928.1 hypothetical protein [Eubacterium sp.]